MKGSQAIDYEQSLFSLSSSSKTPETRKWLRAWLKARDGRGPRFSRTRACTPLTKSEEKTRGCSQSSQATTSWKAGYAPVVCQRANRLQSAGETITIRSSSRDILPLLSSLKVTYSFLQEIKPWKLKGTAVKLVHWANTPSGRCMFVRISESLIHQSCVVDGIKKNTEEMEMILSST